MRWQPLSQKQLKLLTWWTENSPYSSYNGVIAEGSIRSGKTKTMGVSFTSWSMLHYRNMNFAICGKTIGSLRRNVITELKETITNQGYKVLDRATENKLIISKGNTQNIYYLFGGRDERSQDLVQGITLAGCYLDEVALMPQSFVEQVLSRCSIDGSKYWFNCNPEGPQHWFYTEFIKQAERRKLLRLHFQLDDNLSLSTEIKERYRNMFQGIFYRRFILGEWAFADGVIYDCFTKENNTYNNTNKEQVVPIEILENDPHGGYPIYGSDYGVYNPQVFLEVYKYRKPGDPVPYFFVEKEYYYNSRKALVQKTDEQYIQDFITFMDGKHYKQLIVDPSASSLIVTARNKGIKVTKANNDVEEGIQMVYSLLSTGHIKINEDNCPNLISELGLYIWDTKKGEHGKEQPVKANDHALDALRYAIVTTTPRFEVLR